MAFENGFENISYFIHLFQRKFGCPPSEYRKRNKLRRNDSISR
ncbi:helix-turn-helix domain-containing protein [uncultured Treponema sp.]